MIELRREYTDDYEDYKTFVRSRRFLFETELNTKLKHNYNLLYIFSKFESSILKIDPKSKIHSFYNEVKNNLIIGFDLINMNYINSGKQILRSGIESFFRFIITLSRYIEYRENRKHGIFNATETLKELKSIADCHGVWKLTSYSESYFSNKPIYESIKRLNVTYSTLSGNVHVNTKAEFSLQEYLVEYLDYDVTKSEEAISTFNTIIEDILLVCYYFSFVLSDENIHFETIDVRYFEINANEFIKYELDQIDRNFH